MTVQGVFIEGNVHEVANGSFDFKNSSSVREVIESVVYNVSAGFVFNNETEKEELSGNVTEIGMLNYLISCGIDVKSELAAKEGKEEWKIPFNSSRKRATAAFRRGDGSVRVFVKGAPEIVIQYCSKYLTTDGLTQLDDARKDSITNDEVVKRFAKMTWRTLLVSYKDYSSDEWAAAKAQNNDFATEADRATVENDLNMACIFGLKDPLRPKIIEAV